MFKSTMGLLHGRRQYASDEFNGRRQGGGPTPKGGTTLQRIFADKVDEYLAGRTRDKRSYPMRDSKGTIHDPILSYWTFVNYSRFYRTAKPGHRECRRRRPDFYLNPEGATPT